MTLLDERLQVCAETVGFFGGEYLAHGLIQGGHARVGGDVRDGRPRQRRCRTDVDRQFEVYFVESGSLSE
ncbi:MAG: hypothetical protein QOI79_3898 [Mycobacterium sp.]|nr:hypothetical protein [Mycobacterium sp.]MDT5144531.1 hypothetical protein [Mycobacterium sp.]